MSPILYRYISKEFMKRFGIILGGISSLIYLFDLIEMLRRAATRNVRFDAVAHMVLLKLPQTILQLLPFIILIVSLALFWRLMRARELIALRMIGMSIWQVILPVMTMVSIVKIFELTLLNPLSATCYAQFERLENRRIYEREDQVVVSENGLWVRQNDRYGQFILHAKEVDRKNLKKVSIFTFSENDVFDRRFDAQEARFQPDALELRNVKSTLPTGEELSYDTYSFLSNLTYQQIQKSSAHPNTISFWKLPAFMDLLKRSKLSIQRYKLYWHTMIANIFLTLSMVLLGAGCIYFHHGRSQVLPILGVSIGSGFAIFFISDVMRALGLSGSIPILMAAWAPVLISFLVGVTMVLHSEDE